MFILHVLQVLTLLAEAARIEACYMGIKVGCLSQLKCRENSVGKNTFHIVTYTFTWACLP